MILCNQTHTHTHTHTHTEWVVCSTAHSVSSLSLSLTLHDALLVHPHLQNTALALYNVHLFCLLVADRGLASRIGAFAALQAGDGEAWPQRQLFIRAGGLQHQDQGGGAGARGQAAQAGTD